ncbi:MAG: phosphoenolpyruvate--protein phosphotransferase, partial [Clostridiales bacterium]|nr:phosphoenolpyruvate--protein phosphotransferase [Candidatus Blautia equi]
METWNGTPVFQGIAIGKIRFYSREEQQVLQNLTGNIKKELDDFEEARNHVLNYLEDLLRQIRNGEELLLTVSEEEIREQINLLFSGKFIRAVENIITEEKMNAAYAVTQNRDEIVSTFGKLESPGIVSRIKNIRIVSNLLLEQLGGFNTRINIGRNPVILVTDNLLPSELLEMDTRQLLALVTRQGSTFSHTSIVVKTLEIPSLMGVEITREMDGHEAIVDCYSGRLYLDPNEELVKEYEIRRSNGEKEWKELLKLKHAESVTKDGRKIDLLANIGNQHDVDRVISNGAEGIGLLRSEFQYLGREDYPREKELFEVYKQVAETMGDKVVVIRTVDIGMDKKADYMDFPQEVNPLMGNRGIRLCLDRKRMFRAQLR